MAHPGFFYVDATGHIREKFLEAAYTARYAPNIVIATLFPELTEQLQRDVNAAHISLKLERTDDVGIPGSRVSLIAEIQLGEKLYVYAPGVTGYKPIELRLDLPTEIKGLSCLPHTAGPVSSGDQRARSGLEGHFRMVKDVTVKGDRDFLKSLGSGECLRLTSQGPNPKSLLKARLNAGND